MAMEWSPRMRAPEPHEARGARIRFEPAFLVDRGEGRLLPHEGTAGLSAWRGEEALAELPAGRALFDAGIPLRAFPFRRHGGGEGT